MLFMIGTLQVDTRPFAADDVSISSSADLVEKGVMGGLKPSEFTGEGTETVTIRGQLLPFKIGGMDELQTAQEMRRQGARVPLMRGDGTRMGTYSITSLQEGHKELIDGRGFVVGYTITLRKQPDETGQGQQVVQSLLSLFDMVGA